MVREWNQDVWNWHQWEIIPSSICLLLATSEIHTVRFTIIRKENVGLNVADLMTILILVTNAVWGKGWCFVWENRGEWKLTWRNVEFENALKSSSLVMDLMATPKLLLGFQKVSFNPVFGTLAAPWNCKFSPPVLRFMNCNSSLNISPFFCHFVSVGVGKLNCLTYEKGIIKRPRFDSFLNGCECQE